MAIRNFKSVTIDFILKIILISGFAILIYGIFSYWRIQGLIRESRVLIQEAHPYTRHVSDTAPKALFIGDSTGVGVGSNRKEDSVAGRFALAYPSLNIDNLSKSGKKTRDIVSTMENISGRPYAYLILQIGANDIVSFSNTDTLRSDIKKVLLEAKRISENVFLMTSGSVGNAPLLPRPFAFVWERQTRVVRKIFKEEADKSGARYVDLFMEKDKDPFALDPIRYHAPDLFHPNKEGYGIWYKELEKVL